MKYYKYKHQDTLYFKTNGKEYWYWDATMPVSHLKSTWVHAGSINMEILQEFIRVGDAIPYTEKEMFIEVL